METHNKRKKNEKEGFEKRSPLQHLNNGLQIRKPITKKTSNLSSSSSRTNLPIKPKTLSTITNNASLKSSAVTLKSRSKENEVPKKPFSQKSLKTQPPCHDKKQYGKANTKPIYKNAQRSKLFSAQANPVKILKKGSEEFEKKLKNSQKNGLGEPPINLLGVSTHSNLNCIESCTPAGKIESACGLNSVISFDQNVKEDSISKTDNAEKTPPVEASVSPEIQCGSHSRMLVAKSGATPVCYGAGHILSGVTDKRKCRRRGSLKGGCEKINLFNDEKNDGNVISDSHDSPIPLPAEASVRWLLSPCDEGREDRKSDLETRLEQCNLIDESVSVELDLLSSPSTLSANVSNLECDNSNCSGQREAGIITLSPRENPDFRDFFGHSDKKMNENLLVTTPNSDSSGEGNNVRDNVIENNSAFSLGSLSIGNIIQTPSSDSSSYGCLRGPKVDFVQFELDSITKSLNKVGLSPRSEMLLSDACGIGLQCADMDLSSSISLTRVQENVDSVCSWVSDSTLENLALSQTKISWKDGLLDSRIDENDEFDCCRCLSDEEIDADECSGKELHPLSQSGEEKEREKENEESDLGIYSDVSPILLEYEPCISTRGKEKLSPRRLNNTSAESICTNGGDLVASGDSDWTYFRENNL